MSQKFLLAVAALAASIAPHSQAQTTGYSRSILYAQEFKNNPRLIAHARQTVVLDNEPNPFEEPVIRYELERGRHDFRLRGTLAFSSRTYSSLLRRF